MCTWIKKCIQRENEYTRLATVLEELKGLTPLQKSLLRFRYIYLLQEFSKRCFRYSLLFHLGHFIITVGSLIVPALLSVQYADTKLSFVPSEAIQAQIYWTTWVLSLLVTTFNGILVLYKVDKKYYFLHTTRERLRSEGWQYFELTGRYAAGTLPQNMENTHLEQFVYFCNHVEKIRMLQIQEEYYKYDESSQNSNDKQQKEIFPPSLSKDESKRAVNNPTVKAVVDSMVVATTSTPRPLNTIMEAPPSSSEK